MKKIASFTVDHRSIVPGMYISRVDGDVTTYDLRTRRPNCGSYMDDLTMHSVEHLFATYIRNSSIGGSVIYFGPMGCQTGFYLLLRNVDRERAVAEVKNTLRAILDHSGPMFGASEVECGNYTHLSTDAAKLEAASYLKVLESSDCSLEYPAPLN